MTHPELPEVSGRLDADYLSAALARAGLQTPVELVDTEALLGGRTNATVQRLHTTSGRFVLKLVRARSWRILGMGLREGGEALLWARGPLKSLAGGIGCPIIDVGYEPAEQRYWLLMKDVGAAIRDRGLYRREDSRRLFSELAALQASSDPAALLDAPLPPVSGPTDLFRLPLLHQSGKSPQSHEWVHAMLADFKVMGAFLPLFLDILGPRLADAYLDLADDESWVRLLDEPEPTLLHGDLRRANIALFDDGIQLFDWEFAARGPIGCDLQWHNLLHYWAYPPDGVEAGDDCDDLAEHYLSELERLGGGPVDRGAFERGWKLGWLKVMAQIGYVLVDPLFPDGGDEETTQRVRSLCARAVQRAIDMRAELPS